MTNLNDANATKELDAVLALSRFGLGADSASMTGIRANPRAALREEITERFVPTPVGPDLQPSADLLVALFDFQEQRKADNERLPAPAATSAPSLPSSQMPAAKPSAGPRQPGIFLQQVLLAEADARFNGAIREPIIGFGERLAMFWANHFAVSIAKGEEVRVLAGAFEREAIRPHVFGRFSDMLLAVETHPAMIYYLDNQQSIGPNSRAGIRSRRGLNENLARETMELHTLGVDGGYTQADVIAFANILTGWTVNRRPGPLGDAGVFVFNANAHEPGDQLLLGLTYAESGMSQGRGALMDLARHPATARHIATALASHFVADAPPQSLVLRLTAAYTKTNGDLPSVYRALIDADEAWTPTRAKVRSPMEFLIAMLRASGEKPKPNMILAALNAMGQPLWGPPQPNGYSDAVASWASSEGLRTRIDAAGLFANAAAQRVDPRSFAADLLGPLLSPATLQAISRAETKEQGVSIAFLSPEFQRR